MSSLLQPLQIGNITLPWRVVQAPLAGYSTAPMRALACRYGQPGFVCTEMISAKDLQLNKPVAARYLTRSPEEYRVCYQISGNNENDIAAASERVQKAGADLIDLNCGCPVKKIRGKGCGTKLLTDPHLIGRLVATMKRHSDCAIGIKIRVGEPLFDSDDQRVVTAAAEAGVDFITVHGRHWTERYDVHCRLDTIAKIVEYVDLPIIACGDVSDTATAEKTAKHTGCAGVMIGRAAVGDPWLFARIRSELSGGTHLQVSLTTALETFYEHLTYLAQLANEKMAVLHGRKLIKYYLRHYNGTHDIHQSCQRAESLAEIRDCLSLDADIFSLG